MEKLLESVKLSAYFVLKLHLENMKKWKLYLIFIVFVGGAGYFLYVSIPSFAYHFIFDKKFIQRKLFKRKMKKKMNDDYIPSPPATSKYAKKSYGSENNLITEKKNGYVYVTELDSAGKKLWKFKYKPPNFENAAER